ncbi:hypothetical protein AX774_g7522 [Zancudomyces culisetae]|uniref:Uncharacterized protein n=1 Tax=Zancudomyces culisetae TaxID=1213189 RepID=A0A1R1PDX1_ZANCU|nr:hypothetical protein AX774_g7522 [Zancudomyces culisetae]|eukprot:OMH79072.1 hypothetical protein AX774_g7522 [Zancudomyces culisetae]
MERLPNQLSSELKEFDIISELDSTCRLAIDENQHHIYIKARLDAISLKISERNNCIRKENKTLNIVKKGDGVNYDHRVFEELHELKFLIIGYHLEYLFTDLYLCFGWHFY